MQQDFSKRFAIVVRRDIESWQITNTVAHIAAKLGRAVQEFETGDSFTTKDTFAIPRNSQYPIIVFEGRNSADLQALLKSIQAAQLPHLAFIREMIDFADDHELQKALAAKTEAEVEYLGVGTFGENEILKQLTKKFSLWK